MEGLKNQIAAHKRQAVEEAAALFNACKRKEMYKAGATALRASLAAQEEMIADKTAQVLSLQAELNRQHQEILHQRTQLAGLVQQVAVSDATLEIYKGYKAQLDVLQALAVSSADRMAVAPVVHSHRAEGCSTSGYGLRMDSTCQSTSRQVSRRF